MDRRVLATRRRIAHFDAQFDPPLDPHFDVHFESLELAESCDEQHETQPATANAPVAPTPEEVADVVFSGRRLGQRRGAHAGGQSADVAIDVFAVRSSFLPLTLLAGLILCSGTVYESVGATRFTRFSIVLSDLALFAAVLGYLPAIVRRASRISVSSLTAAGLFLSGATAVGWVIHPTRYGALIVVRLAGAVAIADRLQRANRSEARVLAKSLGFAMICALSIATTQVISGHGVGLRLLGELPSPFYQVESASVPAGLLHHPYQLGGTAVAVSGFIASMTLAGRLTRRWMIVGGAIAGFGAVLSGSRANLAAAGVLVAVITVGTWSRKRRRLLGTLIFLAASAGGAAAFALNSDVWTTKAELAKRSGVIEEPEARLRDGAAIFEHHWVLGVGPGRYRDAAAVLDDPTNSLRTGTVAQSPRPPHNVVVAIVDEIGLLGAAGLLFVGGALASILRRRRLAPVVPLVGLVFALGSDHYTWTTAEGMGLVAFCFGLATFLATGPLISELLTYD